MFLQNYLTHIRKQRMFSLLCSVSGIDCVVQLAATDELAAGRPRARRVK